MIKNILQHNLNKIVLLKLLDLQNKNIIKFIFSECEY